MSDRYARASIAVIVTLAVGVAVGRLLSAGTTATVSALPQTSQSERAEEAEFANLYCKTDVATAVPAGSEPEARKYYGDLSGKIGLEILDPPSGQTELTTTLTDVLNYLGYTPNAPTTFTARDLQDALPAELMDPGAFGKRLGGRALNAGDVLVARFFAPKISDVSQSAVTQAGWRKLVRLRALSGSTAATHGIAYGIVLFNFFAPLGAADPFTGNDSANTQTILVGGDPLQRLYWVDFGKTSEGAKLSHELNAFFDAGHIPSFATAQNGGAAKYHVPCACVSCHGGLRLDFTIKPPAPDNHFRAPLLDYLDTDHWQDRIAAGDDFAGLAAPVLFDPGTFGVILLINAEIGQQNRAAQPDSVLRRAADHWLASHLVRGQTPEPLFARAIQDSPGGPVWNAADSTDAQLLPTLNRYCFRCHGSVFFDIFDKRMVLALRTNVHASLFPRNEIVDKRAAMPPDRDLSPDEFRKLRDLIDAAR